jgi:hypothetical protein
VESEAEGDVNVDADPGTGEDEGDKSVTDLIRVEVSKVIERLMVT